MRTALGRARRLAALLLLALSAWWVLLRRRARSVPSVRPPAGRPGGRSGLPGPLAAADAGRTGQPATSAAGEPGETVVIDVAAVEEMVSGGQAATGQPSSTVDAEPAVEDVVVLGDAPTGVSEEPMPYVSAAAEDAAAADAAAADAEETSTQIPMPTLAETPTMEIPAVTDDLQALRGIGPSMERLLHGLGIVSYRQLALLDGAELERVRSELHDFRSRIEREDWVGQARELHRRKYGTDPA